MKKTIYGILLLVLGISVKAQNNHSFFIDQDWEKARDLAKESNKILIVDFYTEWCGWCKVMDKNTFSDYTTLFYKDGEIVKLIDRDWQVMGMPDVRAQFWKYWYAYDFTDDSESLILFSPQGVQFESQMKAEKFWSELTITKSKR